MDLLPYLRDVTTLTLGNARMDRESATAICRMTTLNKLSMIHAEIDDDGLDELAGLRELAARTSITVVAPWPALPD